jgi:hypothetical protein
METSTAIGLIISGAVLWELIKKAVSLTKDSIRRYKESLRASGSQLCALGFHDYEEEFECGCTYKSCQRKGCGKTVSRP